MKWLAFCVGIFLANAALADLAVTTKTYTWTDPSPTGAVTTITVPSNFTFSGGVIPPPPPPPSATTSVPPNGSPMTTAAGTWKWSSPAAGRAGEYNISLNGTDVGIGIMMEVANGGTLYVNTAGQGWYVWHNGFVSTGAPTAE